LIGLNAQCRFAIGNSGASSAGAFAPASIQARRTAMSFLESGSVLGGIAGAPAACVTASINRLSSLLPATTTGPVLPPLSMKAKVSRRSFDCCLSGPWHL
jgi:hypothetical protein